MLQQTRHCVMVPENIWNWHSTVTITTWTTALGIPPRLHQPKSTKASGTKPTKTNKKNQKRVAPESDKDDSSGESEPRVKIKWRKEQISDDDVELVEDNVELPEKDVEDVDIEPGIGDKQQVSRLFIVVGIDSLNSRTTALMTSNTGLTLKHSL